MRRSLYIGLQLLFLSGIAVANPGGINLSGKISLQASNTALVASDVDFKIRVLSPDGCILYSEKFLNVDLSATGGVFNLTIGNGTALYNAWDATLGTANSKASLIKVFSNGSAAIPSGLTQYPGEVCAGGAYTPADGDTRKVVIEFDPTGLDNSINYVALSPFHRIRSVPYAMLADNAANADKLGGVAAANYAKTADLATAVPAAETDPGVEAFAKTPVTGLTAGACGAGKVLTFNGTSLECVADGGGGGGSTPIATNTVVGTVMVPAGSNISLLGTGEIDVKDLPISKITSLQTTLDGKIPFSSMPVASCAAGEALAWQAPTNDFVCYAITVDTAHVTGFDAAVDARIAADTTKLPVAGGTMTGNINMSNNQLSNVGYVHLQNKAADPAMVPANNGFVWYNSTDKLVKYYDGTDTRSLAGYTGACADGQVLKWDNTLKVWACAADAGSGGADAAQLRGVNIAAAAPTAGQFLKYVGTDWTPTSMPVCTASQTMLFDASGVATCTAISGLTNAAIAAGAAIDRTKLANGTASHVLINDGTGVMSSEAQLAISRGGTGIGTAPTADQVLVGNASSGYDLKTLTQGTGITISTAGSAVTISATATAPADSAYDTKGVVGFLTDADTSGMVYTAAGIAKVNTGTAANNIVKLDGTGKLPAVDGSALTNVNDSTKLPLAGGTMTGAIAMGAFDITNVGNIMMANSKVLGLSSNAADPASPAVGQMWYNSTSNTIKYFDGAVKTLGTSGSGLQSLGGLTDNVQTFATSTAGATFGFTSAAGVHTLNIPIATASKDGVLSQTDFATFNSKLGAVSNTASLADGKVWIGDGTGKAQEQTLSGDVTISNTGVATLGTVSIAKGGTGQVTKTAGYNALSPMTTKGDVTVHNGTDAVRLAVGADGKALVADAAAPEGVKWGDIFATDLANITGLGIVQKTGAGTYITLGTAAPLAVVGTDITLSPLVNANIDAAAAIARTKLANGTASHVLINDGSGVMSSEAQLAISRGGTGIGTAPAADQVLVGNASSGYDLKTLTAGTGVTISTAGSAVTINATATAPADSAYDTKGVVGFLTDADTSGMVYTAAGIAKVNTGTAANNIVKLDGTGKLPAVDGSALTNVNDATKLPLAGGTMTGAINMGAFNITNTGDIMMANSKVLGLSSNAADPASPAVGQMWYNSTSNTIKYFDGAVKTLGVSGSGVQSLGGLTDNSQTFATSTAGPTFGFSSAAGVHTLNIPIATASKDGVLSQTDFATFNSKLSAVSNTASLADSKVWVGDGTGKAQEVSLSGDVTISNTGVATIGTVSIAKGGTGQVTKTAGYNALSPMTTKGDITVHNGTDAIRLGVGADGKALVADAASAAGVKWGDIFATDLVGLATTGIVQRTGAGTYVTLGTASPLAVVGTDIVLNPLVNANIDAAAAIARTKLANGTASHVLINDGSGVMSSEAQLSISRGGTGIGTAPAADQVLVGNASSGYDLKTLTAGTGVTISTAGSAVTINATATAPADSAYDTKGVVGFQTDAATSGMVYSSAGIAKVNTGTGANNIVKLDGTGKLPAVDGSALTNVNDATKLPLAGGTMTGAIAMGGFNITNTGDIMMANSKVLGLSSNAADPASPAVGQMWYNSTSNTIKYFDGAVKTLGVSGSGVQSLGGITDNAQTFATSTAGATFGITSAAGVHTLNIPIATASKDGLLSQTDFATFNGKLGAVSNTASLADGKIWIGDGTGKAQEQTLSGDVTVSNTGVATIGTVSIAKGGTGQTTKTAAFNALSPMTTKGDITVHNGTDAIRLGVGADGKALVADAAAASGVKWGDIFATDLVGLATTGIVQRTGAGTYVTLGTASPLAVVGTDIVLNPLVNANIDAAAAIARTKLANGTASHVLINDGSGVMSSEAQLAVSRGGTGQSSFTDGQLLIGNSTGNTLTKATLTQGAGITITNGNGSITIAADAVTNIADDSIVNADINTAAAIDRSKLANGTANRIVVNSAGGVMTDAAAITASRALVSDANGIPTHSAVTATELGYVSGVTSSIQTQLDALTTAGGTYLPKAGGTMTGNIVMNAQKEVRFADSDSDHYVGFKSPATVTADKIWTLPAADGTAGYVLKTDGAGNLDWVAQTSGPGDASYAAKGVVQFNTDEATSGMTVASGVATVKRTTAALASTILQLDASSKAMVKGLDLKGTTNSISLLPAAGTAAFSLTLPAADGGANEVLKTDGAGNLGWVALPSAASDASYAAKGVVQLDTNLATSGLAVTAGVIKVNTGTNADQILKFTTNGTLPALDGNALTNLDVSAIASASGKYFKYMPNGAECADNGILKWVAASDQWVCGTAADLGAITSVVAGTGLDVNTAAGAATVSVEAELGALNALATTGYVQRTGAATYSTTAGNTLNSNSTVVTRDGSGVSGFAGVLLNNASMNVTQVAPAAGTSYQVTWPSAAPAGNGYVLSSTTGGVMSWIAPASGTGDFKADGTVPMTGVLRNIAGTAALPGMSFVGDTNTGISAATADTMILSTNGTGRMTIDSTGNVGIGKTPTGILDVDGGTAAASTLGTHITLAAQNGGSGGATGGSILLNPGDGTSGWPGGSVKIDTTDGQYAGLEVANNTTSNYTSTSASNGGPTDTIRMVNGYNLNNNSAILGAWVKNSSTRDQGGYMGFVSVSGAGVYSPDFVLGNSTASNAYSERVRILGASGYVGIGTTAPGAMLDVKGAIRMSGSTSGYTGFQPAAAAGSTVWTLPATDGTTGQVLKTDGSGNLGWVTSTTPGDASYAAKGIVQFDASEATSGMTVASGVASVKRTTAALADTILQLDSSSKAMVKGLDLKGTTNSVSIVPTAGTAAYTLTLPAAQGGASTVLQNDGSGNMSWVTALTSVNSAAITDGSIVDADINASAAITRSKMANGSNWHVLINDGSGVMSSEANLAVSRGGTGNSSFTANSLVVSGATTTSPLAALNCSAGQVPFYNGATIACSTDFIAAAVSSAVNYVLLTGSTGTSTVKVSAAGTGANLDLTLAAKGTGTVKTDSTLYVNGTYVERAPANVATTGTVNVLATANLSRHILTNATLTTLNLPACPASSVTDTSFSLTIKVTQSAAGTGTLAWSTASGTIEWDSSTEPPMTTTANKSAIYQFLCYNGDTAWYGMQVWKQ